MDLNVKRLMDDTNEPSNGVIDSRVSCSPSSDDYMSFYLDVVQCVPLGGCCEDRDINQRIRMAAFVS